MEPQRARSRQKGTLSQCVRLKTIRPMSLYQFASNPTDVSPLLKKQQQKRLIQYLEAGRRSKKYTPSDTKKKKRPAVLRYSYLKVERVRRVPRPRVRTRYLERLVADPRDGHGGVRLRQTVEPRKAPHVLPIRNPDLRNKNTTDTNKSRRITRTYSSNKYTPPRARVRAPKRNA